MCLTSLYVDIHKASLLVRQESNERRVKVAMHAGVAVVGEKGGAVPVLVLIGRDQLSGIQELDQTQPI